MRDRRSAISAWLMLSVLLASAGCVLLIRPAHRAFATSLGQAPASSPTPTPSPSPSPAATPAATPSLSQQAGSIAIQGQLKLIQGDAQGALTLLNQALALFQKAGDLKGQSQTLAAIGQAYSGAGEYTQALDAQQRALALAKQTNDPSLQLTPLQEMAQIYDSLGQFDNALNADQQALASARAQGDQASEITILDSTAGVYSSRGQYDSALSSYQQALALAQTLGDSDAQQSALLGIGNAYSGQTQYLKALDADQQALTLAQAESSLEQGANGDPFKALLAFYTTAGALNNIGFLYTELGEPDKALGYFQQALTVEQNLNDSAGEETAYNNIGESYSEQGQYDQALTEYQQALQIAQTTNDQSGEEAELNNIGEVNSHQGQTAKALEFFQQALKIAQNLNDVPGQRIFLNNIGSAYRDMGQLDQALSFYQQSLTLAQNLKDPAGQSTALSNIGAVYEGQGNLQPALDAYQQALALEESLRASVKVDEFKTSLGAQTTGLYQHTVLTLLGLGQPDEAFNLTERARARTFLDQLGNTPLEVTKSSDPQLLQQEQSLGAEVSTLDSQLRDARSLPPDQQNADQIQSLSQQLQTAQQQYTDTLTQLQLADPETASLVSVQPLGLAGIQQLLDPNTTLLSYFVTPDKTLAFLVTQSGFQEVDLPVKQSDLEAAVADFRSFADTSSATPPQSLQQLYAWLIAPLASQLTTPTVGIIPDGILNYLPFAALSPDGQTYFGDAHTLFALPDASSLPFIQAKRKGSDTTALVLGASQVAGFRVLQYADQEATNVAGLLGTQALTGDAATVTAVAQQGGSVNVLHLAAHADLNSASPLFSRILLEPDSQSDGSLTVQQVYGLNLAQADLVVLSACNTQLGGQSEGDDFVALNRAFIYAGSPSVIASLWTVNDPATSALMTSFYQHLTSGMSKAQALQAAQADTRALYPNPYEWAAFVLTGDPGG
jgi:CHAT domain-containing protein/Tfp pilus assembly protein PilF